MNNIEEWSEQVIESMAQDFSRSVDAVAIKDVLILYRTLLIRNAAIKAESALRMESIRQRLSDLAREAD